MNLRETARNQDCTFNIPNVCNHNRETVVLCHLPDDSGTGKMGGKSPDWIAAFGCSDCHDVIDRRNNTKTTHEEDREFYMRRAMVRTWRIWIETGVIKSDELESMAVKYLVRKKGVFKIEKKSR